jgi:hypothetical protein
MVGGRPLVVGLVVAGLVLGGVAFAAIRGPGGAGGPEGDAGRPNVLVVVTDDARAETLQVMPRTRPHDPRVPEPRYAAASFPELERVGGGGEAEVAGGPAYLRQRAPADPGEVAALRTGQARTLDLRRDPGMERNLLADDDPGNDPPATLAAELAAARTCQGASCP